MSRTYSLAGNLERDLCIALNGRVITSAPVRLLYQRIFLRNECSDFRLQIDTGTEGFARFFIFRDLNCQSFRTLHLAEMPVPLVFGLPNPKHTCFTVKLQIFSNHPIVARLPDFYHSRYPRNLFQLLHGSGQRSSSGISCLLTRF